MELPEKAVRESLMKGIDEYKLSLQNDGELRKFRENVGEFVRNLILSPPEEKESLIKATKVGVMQIIAQIPVMTPVITAMLQVVTGEDTDTRLDELGSKMENLGSKMDRMLALQEKTINLQEKTISL